MWNSQKMQNDTYFIFLTRQSSADMWLTNPDHLSSNSWSSSSRSVHPGRSRSNGMTRKRVLLSMFPLSNMRAGQILVQLLNNWYQTLPLLKAAERSCIFLKRRIMSHSHLLHKNMYLKWKRIHMFMPENTHV